MANPPTLAFPIIIAAWQRNSREIVRVALDRYNNRDTIDIRAWWQDGEGNWRAGRSGLTLARTGLQPSGNAAIGSAVTRRDAVTVRHRDARHIASPPTGPIVGNMTDVERAGGHRYKSCRKAAQERATLGIATLGQSASRRIGKRVVLRQMKRE